MRPVSLRHVASWRMLATMILGTLVAAASAPEIASAQTPEVAVRTLGGPNRFSGPMHGVDDLRTMVTANQSQITSALQQAGLSDISTQWFNTVNSGYVSDTTVAPGTHFVWMALKRAGRPGVLRNVRWTGRQSFDAFQFSVEAHGYNYTFIVPKICGNFALVTRTAVVAAATPPPEPPPPAPPAREPAPAPAQAPPPPAAPAPAAVSNERTYPWMATGYLGTSFTTGGLQQASLSTSSNDGGLTYGFQVGYLKKYVGGEFIGEFAPNFKLSNLALADEPTVNSWMFNLIGAAPIGGEQFAAYASGGIGGITMRTSTLTLAGTDTLFVGPNTTGVALNTINNAQTKFAYNIGAGFLAYVSQWGIRGDIRYYQAATTDQTKLENGPTAGADLTQSLLSGLTYWRANLGITYRW